MGLSRSGSHVALAPLVQASALHAQQADGSLDVLVATSRAVDHNILAAGKVGAQDIQEGNGMAGLQGLQAKRGSKAMHHLSIQRPLDDQAEYVRQLVRQLCAPHVALSVMEKACLPIRTPLSCPVSGPQPFRLQVTPDPNLGYPRPKP